MASDLLPYPLFGGNVSENVVVSKAAEGNDRKYASPNTWKLDQGIEVDSTKQEVADISGEWVANCNNYQWSAGQGEIVQGDWVLDDKMSLSLAPKEVWKDNENMNVGNLDIPGLGERGFSQETRAREMDLKTTLASITEWFDDLAVDSEELGATAQIESHNRHMKYLLAELWEIGHSNLEDICTSVGKPGNIVREDNMLFAEWGLSNSFRKTSKDQAEYQRLSGCNDYRENANDSAPKDKANQEKQKILAPSGNAVDIMLDFHVPENHKDNLKEHGEYLGTKLRSSLNRMSTRIGSLACEAVTMEKGIFPLREEENDIISKLAGDGQWLEHIFGMGTALEGTNMVPKLINPYSGVLHLVKENTLNQVHQRCHKVDIAEHLACSPGMAFTDGNNSDQVEKGICSGEFKNFSDEEAPGGSPHEAIFFTLAYLRLQDLLSVERVCKSLRAAVKNDELLWRHLHVEHPLSKKFTNDALIQLSSRAQGHLQCLSLVECLRVTDDGLKSVLDSNPNLTKLCLPGCTRVSAEGIVQMVKDHTEKNRNGMSGLKHLRIRGLYGLTKDHLDNLKSSVNGGLQKQTGSVKPQFYHNGHYSFTYDDDRSIDVEVCPKCDNARLVYDCTRERCQQRKDHKLQQCRGCIFCIARCEECGRCIDDNEYEETFCLDLLCSSCWLQLPKCLECNRPGCGRHADHFMRKPDTTFVCGDCRGESAGNFGPDFHGFV